MSGIITQYNFQAIPFSKNDYCLPRNFSPEGMCRNKSILKVHRLQVFMLHIIPSIFQVPNFQIIRLRFVLIDETLGQMSCKDDMIHTCICSIKLYCLLESCLIVALNSSISQGLQLLLDKRTSTHSHAIYLFI